MRQDFMDVSILLDGSGSMQPLLYDTIGGFNRFLEEQKKLPVHVAFTLVVFNHNYHLIYGGIPIKAATPLTDQNYCPGGTTALLDAVGRLIDETGERLKAMPENERPGKVLIVIITDGQENTSRRFCRQDIFDRINRQQDVYKWDFVFMGANQDSFAEAGAIGLRAGNVINCSATANGVRNQYGMLAAQTYPYAVSSPMPAGFFDGQTHADEIDKKKAKV
jgi:hypothetical protein